MAGGSGGMRRGRKHSSKAGGSAGSTAPRTIGGFAASAVRAVVNQVLLVLWPAARPAVQCSRHACINFASVSSQLHGHVPW
jgi:hypothetical protein